MKLETVVGNSKYKAQIISVNDRPEYVLPPGLAVRQIAQVELNRVKVIEDNTPVVRIDTALRDCMLFENPRMYLRKPEAKMLEDAAHHLYQKDPRFTLFIRNAWRSLEEQEKEYRKVEDFLLKEDPSLEQDSATLYSLITQNVADPRGSLHSSAAALDLTILDERGRELGIGVCERTLEEPAMQGTFSPEEGANSLCSAKVSKESFRNRLLLATVMKKAGFIPDYDEWWHYNGRNRAWAVLYSNHNKTVVCPYGDLRSEDDVHRLLVECDWQPFKKRLPETISPRIFRKSYAEARRILIKDIKRHPAVLAQT